MAQVIAVASLGLLLTAATLAWESSAPRPDNGSANRALSISDAANAHSGWPYFSGPGHSGQHSSIAEFWTDRTPQEVEHAYER